MKNYKIYKFLTYFCFFGWIPFGIINPAVGAIMFFLFWIFLIVSGITKKELKKQKLNDNVSEDDQYYNLFQSYQKIVENLSNKNVDLVSENINLKLENHKLAHVKEDNDMFPIVTKFILKDNLGYATFNVIYASRRNGTETVKIDSDRFQELVKLTMN